MEKIGESPWTDLVDVDDYHHTVLLDRKIWLFSRRYVAQPNHNFGHHVAFQGGYSAYFSLESKQWSQKVTFPSLSEEENMDEFLFVLNSHIFLLLFSHFGGITFHRLYIWDEVARNWDEHKSFQVDPACNEVVKGAWKTEIIAVDQDPSSNTLYFISSNDHSTVVHQLSIDNKLDVKLSLLHKLVTEDNAMHKRPVIAARSDDKIYWLEGVHGCGFRIQPGTLKSLDIKENKFEEQEVEGEHPPFSYSGSRCARILPSGQWIHATGDTAVGMTAVKFCGQVWVLDVKKSQFAWKKLELEVPECDGVKMLVIVSHDGVLYVIDPKLGILEGKLPLN